MRDLSRIKADLECETKALRKAKASLKLHYGGRSHMTEEYFLMVKRIQTLQAKVAALKAEYRSASKQVRKDPTRWDHYSLG